MNAIIQMEHVAAAYGQKEVLSDVSLTIYERDFLGIIGPNGGGKTTLLKVMLGMKRPTRGTLRYLRDGREVKELRMGYLPQSGEIDRRFPITVYETVLSGLNASKPILRPFGKKHHEKVAQTLDELELTDLAESPIGTLSGGQLQRVLLARAVVSDPEVVILDEPNTYIDRRFQEQMYKLLEDINRRCAVVMVSHDIGSVLQNVREVACVNHHLHYHAAGEISEHILEEHFGCPMELLGHGTIPHRVLQEHDS